MQVPLLFLLLGNALAAAGQGPLTLGEDCLIQWRPNADSEMVDRYRVQWSESAFFDLAGGATVDISMGTRARCSALGIDTTRPGQYFIRLAAHNEHGWGEYSPVTAFRFVDPRRRRGMGEEYWEIRTPTLPGEQPPVPSSPIDIQVSHRPRIIGPR